MASGSPVYQRLLKEVPIDEDETVRDYALRIWEKRSEYDIQTSTFKVFQDSIRNNIPPNRQVKIKRSETLLNGAVVSEKFGFVKEEEIQDKSDFEAKRLTTNPYGGQWVKYEKKEIDYLVEITNLFKDLKFDKVKPFKKQKSKRALKVTLSDIHIGMSVENSLFEYKYGKDEFYNSLDMVFESIMSEYLSNGRFDAVIIQDLGDGLDGRDAQTTRGGHYLEQNMSNNEAFRVYIHGKISLFKRIAEADITNSIEIYDTVNCNHAGDFGYSANYAVKLYMEAVYKDIKYTILEKFIEHFFYGEHCFIQCHGKDKHYMKSGMPLKLDDKTQKIISQYIDRNKIVSKYIHFEKGDLHQIGFNKCKEFDYRNFMSFAPPSNWVQHNFGDGYSGYSIQIIEPEKREIKHIDYFLDYSEV